MMYFWPFGRLFLSTLSLRRATRHCTTYLNCSRFLSTLSLRRATQIENTLSEVINHFYPRSPCGERHSADCSCRSVRPISIHALLAESDPPRVIRKPTTRHFYPRSPCGERQVSPDTSSTQCKLFLSTLSLRRATCYSLRYSASCWHFYPRSPCGERRPKYFLAWYCMSISIHALLAESDTPARMSSRLLLISIHALLAESD